MRAFSLRVRTEGLAALGACERRSQRRVSPLPKMPIRASRRRAASSTFTPTVATTSATVTAAIATAAAAAVASCAAAAPMEGRAEVHPIPLAPKDGLIPAASHQEDYPGAKLSGGAITAIVLGTFLFVFCMIAAFVAVRTVSRRRRLAEAATVKTPAVGSGNGAPAKAAAVPPVGKPPPSPSPATQAASAAGVAASAPSTASAQPAAAGPNGSGSPTASLHGGGGSGGDGRGAAAGVVPATVGVGAKADVASALSETGAKPGLVDTDGLGVSTSEVAASGVESSVTTSGGWVPPPPSVVPPSAPEIPAPTVYPWTPAVAYPAAAPGGGGPYVQPNPLAYVGGVGVSGGGVPYQQVPGMLGRPTGAAAVATGPFPSPPSLPASLYDTHGPEDPALVARVTPAPPPVSPPGGDIFGLPPAESFSDRVDVDALFRKSTEEIDVDEQR